MFRSEVKLDIPAVLVGKRRNGDVRFENVVRQVVPVLLGRQFVPKLDVPGLLVARDFHAAHGSTATTGFVCANVTCTKSVNVDAVDTAIGEVVSDDAVWAIALNLSMHPPRATE